MSTTNDKGAGNGAERRITAEPATNRLPDCARQRLAARARQTALIRRRIVVATLAAFALAWGVIAFAGSMGTTTTASARGATTSASASSSDDATSSDDAPSSSFGDSSAAVTTAQS